MELVKRDDRGFWKPTKESLATVQQSKSQMILQFQKQCLELSKQALESPDGESRDMTTFTFAVSKAAQAKVEKAAEKFKAQLRQIVTADAGNLNITPAASDFLSVDDPSMTITGLIILLRNKDPISKKEVSKAKVPKAIPLKFMIPVPKHK